MDFYLSWNNNEGVLTFPVVPSEGIQVNLSPDNYAFKSITGDMVTVGKKGLATLSISSFFPMRHYSFARPGSEDNGRYYIDSILAVMDRQIPFRAILTDNSGATVFNYPVVVESFVFGLNTAGDYDFTLDLKEYRFAKYQADNLGTMKATGVLEKTKAGGTIVQTGTQAAQSAAQGFARRYTDSEAVIMAKIMFNEARGMQSRTEIACIGWTICNRVDAGYGTLYKVMTSPKQFAYTSNAKTVSDHGYDLVALARDVLDRWSREKAGQSNVGRVLPAGYFWYWGNGKHNFFFNKYAYFSAHATGYAWKYTLQSPYAS